MKLDKLFESWNSFLNESDGEKEQQVIYEISDQTYDMMTNYLGGEIYIDDLRFASLFGDKLRMVKELKTRGTDLRSDLVHFIQNNGWEIVIEPREVQVKKTRRMPDGSEQRVVSTETRNDVFVTKKFEVDPEKLASFTKGDRGPKDQVRKIKLGKMLNKLAKSKLLDPDLPYEDRSPHWDRIETPQGPYLQAEFPNIREHYIGERQHSEELDSTDNKMNLWNEYWNKKSAYFSEKPEELTAKEKKYVIFSRDPIDVIRMSDWSHIKSCHTEGSSHFHCAIKEARNSGFVVYLVDEASFDNEIMRHADDEDSPQDALSSFDSEEIFSDSERGVSGIDPTARLRVRRYVNYEDDIELAIPETAVYGDKLPGFYTAVKNWLHDNQEDPEKIIDPNRDDVETANYMHEFYLTGGSYEDNSASDLWNKYFNTDIFTGNVEHDDEGDPEDQYENMGQAAEYERRSQELNDYANANLNHISAGSDVDDHGFGENPYISFWAGGSLEFPAHERAPNEDPEFEGEYAELPDWSWNNSDTEVADEIKEDLDNKYFDTPPLEYGTDGLEIEETEVGNSIRIELKFSSDDYDPDPDGYESFIDNLEHWDSNWIEVKKVIKTVLRKHGILQKTAVQLYATAEREFKHFDIDEVTDGYEIEQTDWVEVGTALNLPASMAKLVGDKWNRSSPGGGSHYTIEWVDISNELLDGAISQIIGTIRDKESQEKQVSLDLNEARSKAGYYQGQFRIIKDVLRKGFKMWLDPIEEKISGPDNGGRTRPFSQEDYELGNYKIRMKMRFDLPDDLSKEILEHFLMLIDYIDDNMEWMAQRVDAILQGYNIKYKRQVEAQIEADRLWRDEFMPDLEKRMAVAGKEMIQVVSLWQSLIPKDTLEDQTQQFIREWINEESGYQDYMTTNHTRAKENLETWGEGEVLPDMAKHYVKNFKESVDNWERSKPIRDKINTMVTGMMKALGEMASGKLDWPIAYEKIVGIDTNAQDTRPMKRRALLGELFAMYKDVALRGLASEGEPEFGDYKVRQLARTRAFLKRYERKVASLEAGEAEKDIADEVDALRQSAEASYNLRFSERMNTSAVELDVKRAEHLLEYIVDNEIKTENDLPRRYLLQLNYLRGLYRDFHGQPASHMIPEMEKLHHHQFIGKLDRMVAYLNKAFEAGTADYESVFTRPELKRGGEGLHALRQFRDNIYQVYTWATQNFGSSRKFMDSESPKDLKISYTLMERWLDGTVGMGVGDYDGLVDLVKEELPESPGSHILRTLASGSPPPEEEKDTLDEQKQKHAFLKMFRGAGII